MVTHPDQKHIFLFGGQRSDMTMSNDIYFYNVQSRKWKKINAKGILPSPRAHHSMILVGDSMVMIFGGVAEDNGDDPMAIGLLNDLHLFNLNEHHWVQPTTGGMTPCPRYGHSMI